MPFGNGSVCDENQREMNTQLSSTLSHAQGGFTEEAFEAFLRDRDEPAGWSSGGGRRSPDSRLSPGPARATRNGGGPTSGRSSSTHSPLRRPASLPADDRDSLEHLWQSLSSHYATGIEHINGALARQADPSRLGRAVFVDLDRAVKDHPELLERYLLTEAVTPGDDIFAALHAAFWTGGTLLYVPRGVKLEAPLFSLVGLAQTRGSSRHGPHPGRARRRGRGHAGARDGWAGWRRDHRRCTSGLSRSSLARGRRLRLVNIQNWDDATWHFSRERAIVGPRRRLAMDRRRPGLASGQGQPGSRACRAGGRGPGQRRHVHHRPPASGLFHPAGPRRPAHHQRPALQGGAQGPVADRLEGDDPRREGRPAHRRLPEKRQPRALAIPPAPTRSPGWRSRPTTCAAPMAPRRGGSTKR